MPLHALVTSAPSSILWQPSDEHAPTNEDEQSDEHAIKEPTRLALRKQKQLSRTALRFDTGTKRVIFPRRDSNPGLAALQRIS